MTARVTDEEVSALLEPVRTRVLADLRHVHSPRRSRRFRVVRAVAIGGIAAIALTAGSIVVLRATPEQINHSVSCYGMADPASTPVLVSAPSPVSTSGEKQSRTSVSPVDLCEDMWRMGLVGQSEIPTDPNAANFSVPDLVACTQSDGVGAAFPREGLPESDKLACAALGLAVWP